jgi:hypothetical protein
MWESVRTIVKP